MTVPILTAPVLKVTGTLAVENLDSLAIEEPLEIRLIHGPANNRQRTTIAITMRTPGHDVELAVGYLVAEGLLNDPCEILHASSVDLNLVRVDLKPDVNVNLAVVNRRGIVSSSCGLCGKTALDRIEADGVLPLPPGPRIRAETMHGLAQRLRMAQPTFDATGGLHAVGLFDPHGELIALREDVGRHNAADKVIGSAFLARQLPLQDRILFASSRASFEMVQKAAVAGISVFAAVGAPTSLALQLAERWNMTLIGFLREDRFNIYSGYERVQLEQP